MYSQSRSTPFLAVIGLALALLSSGCADWLGTVPTVALLPTLTPSPVVTSTPAIGLASDASAATASATPLPTATATITLTPNVSATPPLGPTATPDQTQTLMGPGGARALQIVYFVATPERVLPGEPVLLFWSARNSSGAAVYRLNSDGTPGRTWAVTAEGSLTVSPQAVAASETYVLAVTNGITTIERQVVVEVECPYTWFFAPAPPDSCPQGPARQTGASMQAFERGRMFWLAASGEIIILFDDFPTGASDDRPAWIMLPDPYVQGEPEEDPAFQPPEGLRQPRRGFGSIWRSNAAIRDRLGWAVGDELPYSALIQRVQVGDFAQPYFSNPSGEAITLMPDRLGWLVAGFYEGTP